MEIFPVFSLKESLPHVGLGVVVIKFSIDGGITIINDWGSENYQPNSDGGVGFRMIFLSVFILHRSANFKEWGLRTWRDLLSSRMARGTWGSLLLQAPAPWATGIGFQFNLASLIFFQKVNLSFVFLQVKRGGSGCSYKSISFRHFEEVVLFVYRAHQVRIFKLL